MALHANVFNFMSKNSPSKFRRQIKRSQTSYRELDVWESCGNVKLHSHVRDIELGLQLLKTELRGLGIPSPTGILWMHLKHLQKSQTALHKHWQPFVRMWGWNALFYTTTIMMFWEGWAALAPHATSSFILKNLHCQNCMWCRPGSKSGTGALVQLQCLEAVEYDAPTAVLHRRNHNIGKSSRAKNYK